MCGKQRCGEILQPVRQLMAQGESPCRQVGAGDPGRAQGQRQALCTSAPTALLGGWHSCSGQGQWVGVREQPELIGDDVWPLDSFRELGIQQQTRQAGMASQ